VKLCDFGSAMRVTEVEIVMKGILGSRFYRSPEVMVGLMFDCAIDTWAMACTLAELYTGRFLFKGDDNNDMLKLILSVMGPYPIKLIRRGKPEVRDEHFDVTTGLFLENQDDEVTGQLLKKKWRFIKGKNTRDWHTILHPRGQHVYSSLSPPHQKKVEQFKDMLGKCLALDPVKRLTPRQVLDHPFVKEPFATT